MTLRISGLFRDAFETQIALFDEAVRAIAARDEPDDWNPLAASVRGLEARRCGAPPRASMAPRLAITAPASPSARRARRLGPRADLGLDYLAASATAYGKGLDGLADSDGFAARVKAADAFLHQQDHAEIDLLDSLDYAAYEGGFAAAADRLGSAPALYHTDISRPDAPKVRTLVEEIARIVRGRAANPVWIEGMMRHGYRGAAEVTRSVEGLFAFAATLPARLDRQFDVLFDATLGDESVDDFLRQENPPAREAMAARFDEAIRRDLWRPRRNSVARPARGVMTAAPAIKGWCPTLLSPMQSGDGWLARVKPTAGKLSADAARIIADAARRHGNGHIDLTSRANLQMRGLSPRSAERSPRPSSAPVSQRQSVARSDPQRHGEPARGDDPTAAFDSHALAREIEAMLAGEPALWALPSKFGVLVDGGGVLPLRDVGADIMVRPEEGALAVQLDGGTLAALCSPAAVAETSRPWRSPSFASSAERSEPPRRMRALVMAVGEEAIFAAAGLASPSRALPAPAPANRRSASFIEASGTKCLRRWAALRPHRGRCACTRLPTLRTLRRRQLAHHALARAARCRRLGERATERCADEVAALGLITDPADPRLRIFACVGAPSCTSASVDARADATRLATVVGATRGDTLHISGCAKACAHRGPASLTLVGRDGRYDLIRNGSAGDRPSLTGLSIDEVVALLDATREQRR